MIELVTIKPTKAAGNALIIRGVLAIIFAVLVLAWPKLSVATLVILFAIFIVLDGITEIIQWSTNRRLPGARRYSSWVLVAGIVSVLGGILAIIWPNVTAVILTLIIGWWALAIGVLQVVAALFLKKAFSLWWLGLLSGGVSIILGLVLVIFPGAGIMGFLILLAVFVALFGVVLVTDGVNTRKLAM
ncbi:HdeD family acid-resistance protein [Paeniglutamicibacter cryotolerans]|uniref:Uncharacterized membrane protein HdeD (DUF308 family) n=1 Tax=Paeniglutamicibacter cryotolerans TaxID=670079 RepID=A0A839QGP8_9MICC|nr:DUF308 domain-containing protein [Paeniglutamicibacter cryotolerans]MBB2995070.1 uncharacterized membrane protein HdeD (DUF308 family) [Paeniglutamicibacter cryotolerans]